MLNEVQLFEKNKKKGRFIKIYADSEDLSFVEAVEKIKTVSKNYEDLLFQISKLRRKGIKALKKSEKNFYNVAKPFIDALDKL